MRIAINLLLLLLCIGLVYVLVQNIKEPITFKQEKQKRENAVIAKLMDIRDAQLHYRGITGEFAPDFDTLKHVLTTGRFALIKVLGDIDAGEEVTYDTTWVMATDSLQNKGWTLDSLEYVPYGAGRVFDCTADTLTYQQTLVHVVEVGTQRKNYMGRYADPRFSKYDSGYNPESTIKFGDLNAPRTAGNWE